MPTRVSNVFGAYDLFAKSFPGTVFLLGFLSLLPSEIFSADIPNSPLVISLLIVTIFLLGFAFGEALHSVAVRIESFVHSVTKSYYKIITYLIESIPFIGKGSAQDKDQKEEITKLDLIRAFFPLVAIGYIIFISENPIRHLISFSIGILIGLLISALSLLSAKEKVIKWGSDVLNPHRKLLERKLLQPQKAYENRLLEEYKEQCNSIFGIEKLFQNNEGFETAYILTMSHLEYSGIGRARQFQAVFSFCRSMWVTLLVYSSIYILMGFNLLPLDLLGIEYRPLIQSILGTDTNLVFVGLVCFLTLFLFMEGERQYKSLFTDYVLADFITSTNEQLSEVRKKAE